MDTIVLHGSPMPRCCGVEMMKMSSARVSFTVNGYNEKNGYCGGGKTVDVKGVPGQHKDMKVSVTHS